MLATASINGAFFAPLRLCLSKAEAFSFWAMPAWACATAAQSRALSAVSQAFDAGQHSPCIGLPSPFHQGQKNTSPSDQGLALKAIQAFFCTIYLSAGM
jgi:hypothetical protein